uniref:Uncharacterized protein n=1 Tax=Anguilla anguilla TaxID=7936 RepID=A0A0E9UP36_ANGAN
MPKQHYSSVSDGSLRSYRTRSVLHRAPLYRKLYDIFANKTRPKITREV